MDAFQARNAQAVPRAQVMEGFDSECTGRTGASDKIFQVTLFSIHQFFAIQESLRSKLMINRSNLPTGCIETVGCERSDRQEVEEIACIARVPLGLL